MLGVLKRCVACDSCTDDTVGTDSSPGWKRWDRIEQFGNAAQNGKYISSSRSALLVGCMCVGPRRGGLAPTLCNDGGCSEVLQTLAKEIVVNA
jgi:hypothetical protein